MDSHSRRVRDSRSALVHSKSSPGTRAIVSGLLVLFYSVSKLPSEPGNRADDFAKVMATLSVQFQFLGLPTVETRSVNWLQTACIS